MANPIVGILMGSDSDFPVMEESIKILDKFGVGYEVLVSSAHRTPERTAEYARTARERGIQVIIVGAGAAAALGGVIAAHTTLPVIGVPIDATALKGVDALYSTVMMPGGIPLASMAIGKAGARNAALFAIEIFSIHDASLKEKMDAYREENAKKVVQRSDALQATLKS